MPFNGIGGFTLVAGNPVVTGTTISSTVQNNTMTDFANSFANCITRDGQSPALSNIPLGGFKLTGLAAGTTNGDAVRWEQVILTSNLADTSNVSNGAALVGRAQQTVDSIAALRLLLKTSASKYARVNGYYTAGDGGGGEYYYDAADVVSADNGGTIIVAADGGRWKLSRQLFVGLQQFGAKFDGATDDTTFIQAAITALPGGMLYAPPATTVVSTLDCRSFYGTIFGGSFSNGIAGTTVFKANTASVSIFNFNNTSDVNPAPYTLRGFTIDGNSLGSTIGLNVRYRHVAKKDSLLVKGCTTGIKELDTYLCTSDTIRVINCGTGWWLVGSNHSSVHTNCTIDSNSTVNLLIQTNGTPADGNDALDFVGCAIQSASGSGVGIDITCTSATFTGCYLGEFNAAGAAIIARGGNVLFNGGALFYGFSATSYGLTPLGGKTVFRNMDINGQTTSGIATVVNGGSGGKFAFYDCRFNGTVSGSPVWPGDGLDYGPQGTVYAERLGKNWTGQGNNVTFSSTTSNNKQTFTVLTAPGPTPLLGARSTLTNTKWRDAERLSFIPVYETNKAAGAYLSTGAFAQTKVVQSGLPTTSGSPVTGLGFQVDGDQSAAYTVLEINQTASAVNDSLTIHEVFLSDSRTLNRQTAAAGNIAKN